MFVVRPKWFGKDCCFSTYYTRIVVQSIFSPIELRLAGGSNTCSGRVEVLHNQQWGTVCNNGWDLADAHVVCREVGCGEALAIPKADTFGKATGPTWMDQVNCTGEEDSLAKCPPKTMQVHSCAPNKTATVACSGKHHRTIGMKRICEIINSYPIQFLDNISMQE